MVAPVRLAHGSLVGSNRACRPKLPGKRNRLARVFWKIPSAFPIACDACEAARFASAASIPPGLPDLQPVVWPPRNRNGSPAKPWTHPKIRLILLLHDVPFGNRATRT